MSNPNDAGSWPSNPPAVPPTPGVSAPTGPAPGAPAGPAPSAPAGAPSAAEPRFAGYGVEAPYRPPSAAPAASSAPTSAYPTTPFPAPTRPASATPAASGTATTATRSKVGAGKIAGILVAACLVGGAAGLGGSAAGSVIFGQSSSSESGGGDSAITINDSDSVNQTTAIAAKALPSVVTIAASSSQASGSGSGVVLSADGYVVTNTHVVTLDGATADATLRVTTSTGDVYNAEIVGTDPVYDLAVIKLVDASGLTPIEFADSSTLNVGETTVALGAPLGLANTVTTGIVSALNRSIQIASSAAPEQDAPETDEGDSGEEPFQFDFGQGQQQSSGSGSISIAVIQTDAAINPGNSGGALVDGEGKLIGINVAIATADSSSDAAGSIGVGFSIPSNIVKRITSELIENGVATHGLLGATVSGAAYRDDATIAGAYIEEISPDGAAESAGLKAGDIVTSFGGVRINDATDLTAQVRSYGAGEKVTVEYQRDGQSHSVEVTLGELSL